MVRRKCVNTCTTAPGRLCVSVSGKTCMSVLSLSASHPAEGNIIIPPSKPFSGRRYISTSPFLFSSHQTVPWRSGFGFLGTRRGRVSSMPWRLAAQSSCHGQSKQFGRLGVHIVAPRSIMACAMSPGRLFAASASTSSAAQVLTSAFNLGSGVVSAKSRVSTRSILPSTGAACWLKAIAAIAAAV